MKNLFFAVLSVMLLGGYFCPDAHADAGSSRKVRLLILGDSISAYRNSLDIASFQVQRKLAADGIGNTFFNAGVPGDNTNGAKARFSRDVLELYPDIVFIMLGTNDSFMEPGAAVPRVALDLYKNNLLFLVRELKKNHIRPVLLSIPPLSNHPQLWAGLNRDYYSRQGLNYLTGQYSSSVKAVAEQEKIDFIDINRAFFDFAKGDDVKLSTLFSDGIHPNRAGQDLISREIYNFIKANPAMLESAAAPSVADLVINEPQTGKKYSLSVPVNIIRTGSSDTIEVRWKHYHYRNSSRKRFSEWEKVACGSDKNIFSGVVKLPEKGTYSLQFRALENGKTVGVAGLDHIIVTE